MIKRNAKENFLEKIPVRKDGIVWSIEENGLVTLNIKNGGFYNRIAQILIKKPRVSFVHLEEFGSFIWTAIDGKRDIIHIGELVKEQFGKKAEPLYVRLATYIKTLEANNFIVIN